MVRGACPGVRTAWLILCRTVNALTTNSGQICFAATRVYVQAEIYDRFVEAYTAAFREKMKAMGDPEDGNVELGPVVDKVQYERILDIIETAKKNGDGTLLAGGSSQGSEVNENHCLEMRCCFADAFRNRAIIFSPPFSRTPKQTLISTKTRYLGRSR